MTDFNHVMTDVMREKIFRTIWRACKLDEIDVDITEDEYVTRAFKGRLNDLHFDDTSIYYNCLGFFWEELKPLIDACNELGCGMHVHGAKEREYLHVVISKKDDSDDVSSEDVDKILTTIIEKEITDDFIERIEKQYAINMKKYEGKETIYELMTACGEEFGEICRCVLERTNPNKEIIDLVAVLYQVFIDNVKK